MFVCVCICVCVGVSVYVCVCTYSYICTDAQIIHAMMITYKLKYTISYITAELILIITHVYIARYTVVTVTLLAAIGHLVT